MKGKTEAMMEYGAKVKEPIASEIAIIGSNKLLQEIRAGNVTTVTGLITKDPIDHEKYVVPVTKVHLAAARNVKGADISFTPENQMVGLLEKVYKENNEKLAKDSVQSLSPELRALATQTYIDR